MRLSHETIPEKPPYPAITIYGRDWSAERGSIRVDYPFTAFYCWVSGLLIHEDEEFLSIAQDYCPATGNVREVWTIPKNTIMKRFDWTS